MMRALVSSSFLLVSLVSSWMQCQEVGCGVVVAVVRLVQLQTIDKSWGPGTANTQGAYLWHYAPDPSMRCACSFSVRNTRHFLLVLFSVLPRSPFPTMSFRPSTQRTMVAMVTASALGTVAYAWVAKGGVSRSPSSLLSRSFGKRCVCLYLRVLLYFVCLEGDLFFSSAQG